MEIFNFVVKFCLIQLGSNGIIALNRKSNYATIKHRYRILLDTGKVEL